MNLSEYKFENVSGLVLAKYKLISYRLFEYGAQTSA